MEILHRFFLHIISVLQAWGTEEVLLRPCWQCLAQNSLVAQIKYFTPHDDHLELLSPLYNSNTLMWLKPCFQELACNHSRQECLHIPPRKLRTSTGLQHIWCFPKLLPVPHWKHPGKHNNKQATIRKKGAKNIPNVYYVLKILQISHTVHFTVT